MSVRKIPKNYRNLTGVANSNKANGAYFESTLERDFLSILEFDAAVQSFDVQPVTIRWADSEGRLREYTPDVLVQYYPNQCSFSSFDTVLCEVKYRSDIDKHWSEYKPKFKAAMAFAKSNGWRFKLFTEREIRTTYMENARFLLPYLNNRLDESHERLLLDSLVAMRETSVEALIKSIFHDKWAQAELIPALWFLVASNRVVTDLNLPLTMSSKVWLRR